jgi:hypothetical protein
VVGLDLREYDGVRGFEWASNQVPTLSGVVTQYTLQALNSIETVRNWSNPTLGGEGWIKITSATMWQWGLSSAGRKLFLLMDVNKQ